MPKQTRVNPAGELVATAARGTLMGNRGCLHDAAGRIVRKSARPQWVSCLLEFKGRKRSLMTPGHYTELFFLDEATALAAGHRPCSTCRHDATRRFTNAWGRAHPFATGAGTPEIDKRLSKERASGPSALSAPPQSLPDGTILWNRATRDFYLVLRKQARLWSFDGYGPAVAPSTMAGSLDVVTSSSIVAVLAAGYQPLIHPSAQ
jgi:hypothetical protein